MSLEMFLHFTVTLCGDHVMVVVCCWRGSSVLQGQLSLPLPLP